MGVGDSVFTDRIINDYGVSHIVDGSPKLLKRASERYGDAVVAYHSYFEDFAPPVLFDAIFATFVMEHVDDPVVCLRKASAWLAPGGRILLMAPNAKSYHRELAVLSGYSKSIAELCETDASVGHKRVYTPERLESDIEKAGLKIRKNENLLFKPLHYGLLRHCNEAELRGLFHMGKMIPNDRRAMLYYVCGR